MKALMILALRAPLKSYNWLRENNHIIRIVCLWLLAQGGMELVIGFYDKAYPLYNVAEIMETVRIIYIIVVVAVYHILRWFKGDKVDAELVKR
jgi:hypothetical protein